MGFLVFLLGGIWWGVVSDTEAAHWGHTKATTWAQTYPKLHLQMTFLFKMFFFRGISLFGTIFSLFCYWWISISRYNGQQNGNSPIGNRPWGHTWAHICQNLDFQVQNSKNKHFQRQLSLCYHIFVEIFHIDDLLLPSARISYTDVAHLGHTDATAWAQTCPKQHFQVKKLCKMACFEAPISFIQCYLSSFLPLTIT